MSKSKASSETSSLSLPAVLSFQRGMVITDGLFYSRCTDNTLPSIRVIRHGIRGVQAMKNNSINNVQTTESAKTAPNANGLIVEFSLRMLPASQLLFNCADSSYRKTLNEFIQKFFKREVPEFQEVCRRYARNILNGRWLWRNRMLGDYTVTAQVSDKRYVSSADLHLCDFDAFTDDEKALAEEVLETGLLAQLGRSPVLDVKAEVNFGFTGSVEVFPSQNMVMNKPKGFARSLYKTNMISYKSFNAIVSGIDKNGPSAVEFSADLIDMGQAALRDQKIGNALRTIDTWYESDSPELIIPIEPNGASLEHNQEFRKAGFYANDLLKRIDAMAPGEEFNKDAAYLIALLIRGGVFSEKKTKNNDKKEAETENEEE